MYERVQRRDSFYQEYGLTKKRISWVVYDENFRDVLFEAANTEDGQQACIMWLRSQCSTGSCEN